jgi:hypothetical protein
MKTLPIFLALTVLGAAARAAVLPISIAASLPLSAAPYAALAPLNAPALSLPSAIPGPLLFPGAAVPLPLSLPVELPGPTMHHLDWSFLDGGDEGAAMLVPVSPAPKPLAPASAATELKLAAAEAAPANLVRHGAGLFDAARQRVLLEVR